MKSLETIQMIFYFALLVLLSPVLGWYMAIIFEGGKNFMTLALGPFERLIYKLSGVKADEEMDWKHYASSLLWFNFAGFVALFLMLIFQDKLPMNPQNLPGLSWHLALNTAVSFVTNTNWQSYAGEVTLSHFTQMAGLTFQNFVSAATGIAVVLAMVRAFTRRERELIGNFWVDLVRSTLYVLLPLSIVLALVLSQQGVVQSFSPNVIVKAIEGGTQEIAFGPAASQVAIKQLGSNGGGFFNANSAHPFENPTPFTNFLEMFSLIFIAASIVFTYGRMAGAKRHGAAIFITMLILCIIGLALSLYSEFSVNPNFKIAASMEGKEMRFGAANSVLWSVATTCASNGSVNCMHDSLTPLSGMVAMLNIMLGEVVFGGVGAGLYGIIMFIILTVFIAGLMVGRTPEYLGKKIESFEVKMAILAVLAPCACILILTAVACVARPALESLCNLGPHGLSEMLYAFSSAAGNNGSAFAGLNANTVFYDTLLAIAMLIGRFAIIIPALAIAGSMAVKKITPPSSGTFPTEGAAFVALLISVILIVGALTFMPVLTLGPVMEQFLMISGKVF